MMAFICLLIFTRELKNRFLKMTINKKRLSQIRKIQKDSHGKKRFS